MQVVRLGDDDAGRRLHGEGPGVELDGGVEPQGTCPLVLVTWRDAWFDFDQSDADDERSDYLVTTVGFLVRSGPRFVSVAQEVLPDGDGFRAITHIPLTVVERMVPLEGPGPAELRDLATP